MKPAAPVLVAPNLALPWSSSMQEDALYRRIVIALLVGFLLFGVVIPLISIPVPDRSKAEAIPAQLAQLVIEQRKIKLPPKPKEVPKPEVKPEAKPETPEAAKPEPKPEPKPVAKPVTLPPPKPVAQQPKPSQAQVSQQQVQQARARASQSGLMAMQSALAEMQQQSANVSSVVATAPVLQAGKPGDGGKVGSAANRVERSMITGKGAGSTSGGISTSGLSRDTGGSGGLAQRSTTQVTSPVAGMGGGPGGVAVGGTGTAGAAGAGGGGRSGGNPARSDETIRAVLEQSKGSLYAIYNRSLRQNPTLAGKVLFELVIEPSGAVSSCRIVSSELGDADLERKLVARLKLLNFGSAAVAQYKSRWEVNFLPSG
jgi:outer membrane biosynthesis protein TonB